MRVRYRSLSAIVVYRTEGVGVDQTSIILLVVLPCVRPKPSVRYSEESEDDTYNIKHVVTSDEGLSIMLTLLNTNTIVTYRMKTSPSAPFDFPSWNSSVFASYYFKKSSEMAVKT